MSLDSQLKGAERHTWSDERGTLSLVRVRDGVSLVAGVTRP
jgi:hypothetical protein